MKKTPKILIVMPAYNAAKTIVDTYKEIPEEYRKKIILTDDQSTDDTVNVEKKAALKGGMPPLKYYVNRIVCFIQNILLGVNFTEHFSGYRAFSKKLLKKVPFQRFSNDFVFDQEMTISSLSYGFEIGEIPIPTRYHEKASSIQFLKGSKFVLEGFLTIFRYKLHTLGFWKDRRFKPNKYK